jgi:hypothetical protein
MQNLAYLALVRVFVLVLTIDLAVGVVVLIYV